MFGFPFWFERFGGVFCPLPKKLCAEQRKSQDLSWNLWLEPLASAHPETTIRGSPGKQNVPGTLYVRTAGINLVGRTGFHENRTVFGGYQVPVRIDLRKYMQVRA